MASEMIAHARRSPVVILSRAKNLSADETRFLERPFAESILSEAEGLRARPFGKLRAGSEQREGVTMRKDF